MKKAVMYGAGNIGRGFIGEVFSLSGYEVVFLDVMKPVIDAMNERGEYTVRVVSNENNIDTTVKNIRAVDSLTTQAAEEIASADIMATAVGVNILPKIAPVLAAGVSLRAARGGAPLNIIIAENQLDADKLMRSLIYENLSASDKAWAEKNLGLVEASIGRMVPRMTPEQRGNDPLLICVESYMELPVDSAAFKGEIPALKGLIPFTPFGFYIKRKLFLHNMSHALLSYLGYIKGYIYIWQAADDAELGSRAEAAMLGAARALHAEYGVPIEEINANVYDLLSRFKNRALGDTVARVGADPIRKLRRDDRLTGAALYMLSAGEDVSAIISAIKAALRFDPDGDASAAELISAYKERGAEYIIAHYMGLKPDEPLYALLKQGLGEK